MFATWVPHKSHKFIWRPYCNSTSVCNAALVREPSKENFQKEFSCLKRNQKQSSCLIAQLAPDFGDDIAFHELFWSLGTNTTLQEHGSQIHHHYQIAVFFGQPYCVNIFCRTFDTIAEVLEVRGTSQQYFEKQSITDKIRRKLCEDCWTNGLNISNKSIWTRSMTLKVRISLGGGFRVFRAAIFFTGGITICFDILNHLSHTFTGRNTLQLHWSHLSYPCSALWTVNNLPSSVGMYYFLPPFTSKPI